MTTKQQQPKRGASYNAVARRVAALGKVGGRHADKRKAQARKACRGSWRAYA